MARAWMAAAAACVVASAGCGGGGDPAPPGVVTPDGTYLATAVRCAGVAAPSPLADLITGGRSFTLQVAGGAGNMSWSDGLCTIRERIALTYPATGHLTAAPVGFFACSPGRAACASLSGATFGGDVCGTSDLSGPKDYLFAPSTVSVGQTIQLTRQGGGECASSGASDPLSLTLTRQP
ncbi:MAG TPA: hypothetical protein VFP50_04605 [Anaeromyxobacteraceae bacterium]|nr:hypothetical protein [Anaeromyxobacteraceae bacterium]